MAGNARKTVRLVLSEAEWRELNARAAAEERSLASYLSRLVRAQLTPQPKRGSKKPAQS
jgi:hypothetical protein